MNRPRKAYITIEYLDGKAERLRVDVAAFSWTVKHAADEWPGGPLRALVPPEVHINISGHLDSWEIDE